MWAGTLPVHHVIALTEHLNLNPHSRVFAERGGTPELQGWDAATVIAARTHNLIASLIQGLSGAEHPEMFIDYPGAPVETVEIRPATLAELTPAKFDRFMFGG